MRVRNFMLALLFVTVVAPIVFYTNHLATFKTSSSRDEFIDEVGNVAFNGHNERLNLLPQELLDTLKEPIRVVYSDNSSETLPDSTALAQQRLPAPVEPRDHKSARVLYTTSDEEDQRQDRSQTENPIREVTDGVVQGIDRKSDTASQRVEIGDDAVDAGDNANQSDNSSKNMKTKRKQQPPRTSRKVGQRENIKADSRKQSGQTAMPDARVQQLKDQLIRAKVYLSLPATRNNPHFTRELRGRVKEVQRALGDASKDSELPRNANDRMKAMELTLTKGKQIQDDCSGMVKKLRAMLHSTEEQLRVHRKQTAFLTQLTAKTLPKGLHCLPLRLTTEYYTLNSSQQQFPNQEKLEDPQLFHYAIFSDNVLAAAVVVNSSVTHAKEPSKHVFHIVTDKLNYAAMRMWFLVNPPGSATVQVQNIEEFTWLNASYSPVLKQLGSPSMIDYYFRAHRANSDSNLKYRNPKYLSILNHLRFYLPEIFPKLNKVLFLDDDVVVRKDLTALWSLDLKGNVNGAVETCGESFHRFDRYLNFSNPLISRNFDPRACGWAYGMNIFDLVQWKRQNITGVYHKWQKLNHDRQLWKLGTLPPGLITFWKRTHPLDRSWHVLGLGYDPTVNQKEIERASVIHYNGNMKPWLEISIPKYRNFWTRYIDYDHIYLRECNINP